MSALLRRLVVGIAGCVLAGAGVASAGSEAPNGQVGLDRYENDRQDVPVYRAPGAYGPGSQGSYGWDRQPAGSSRSSQNDSPNKYPNNYPGWERERRGGSPPHRYEDDDYRDRRTRRIERGQEHEKRDLEQLQTEERKDLEKQQKQERKGLKSAGQWDKDDKRRQKQERKVLTKDQETEDRELRRDQREEWRDYRDRRR